MTSPAIEQLDLPATPELLRKLLVDTSELPGGDFRILTYYVTAAPLGDTVRETAKVISAEIGSSQASVSRGIARLVSGGWLAVAFKLGSVPFYRAGDKVVTLALAEHEQRGQAQQLATVSRLPVRGPAADA